ncbi:MAG: chorismate synthase [Planctomycetaceae bacterium]|nr:chorismate synthase [Planctomycetaceae bacterium]
MANLSYRTAGESHGPGVVSLIEGLPSGISVDREFIDAELARRQGGYGRGARQRIETDRAEFLGGVRRGLTTGAPVAMVVPNRDNRLDDLKKTPPVERPRPGHADLAGSLKWLVPDCRETLERASARETAGRTAMGALARCMLRALGIDVFGFVRGGGPDPAAVGAFEVTGDNWRELLVAREASKVYLPDPDASEAMIESIRRAKIDKDTVGGFVEVHVFGCPPGLGSCVQWDQRLDARLACAVMGIQAFKAVEIGLGRECGLRNGSGVHDPIEFDPAERDRPNLGFRRPTNNAGGLEGGMTNGMPVVVRGTMKPISTLLRGLPSVNLATRAAEKSQYERSDVSAIAAASVVAENVVALEIARAVREKFGGDSMTEVAAQFASYLELARSLPKSD